MMSEWISVDERLPDEGEPCLFFVPLRGYPHHRIAGALDETASINDLCGDPTGMDLIEVEYWMPLPEPPK